MELRCSAFLLAMPIPDVIVASEDVSQGKPAPDGYQLAATRLGRARCLVFEDAPPGIVAAEVAGARVIALRTTHPKADFTGAEVIIPDFTASACVTTTTHSSLRSNDL